MYGLFLHPIYYTCMVKVGLRIVVYEHLYRISKL